jgi:UDP-2,3-diacylglucosamine hydrolase
MIRIVTDYVPPSSPRATRTAHQDPSGAIYFLSDVHLGGSPEPAETVKRERLDALLNRVESEGAALYVLGDLFDFWFEYRTVVPSVGFGILSRLDGMARSGVPVHYLGGNHDFWLNEFLTRETAVVVLPDGAAVEAQGRQIRLYHGDGLGPGDTGYKMLKWVLRNRLAIRLFRWLHPDLGIPLGLRSSETSRNHTTHRVVDVEALFEHVALPEFKEGADAVLMGHHHVPVHLNRDAGEFLILGDWFRQYTCVRLTEGRFQLLTWPLDDA